MKRTVPTNLRDVLAFIQVNSLERISFRHSQSVTEIQKFSNVFHLKFLKGNNKTKKKISNYSQLLKCKGTWSADGFCVGLQIEWSSFERSSELQARLSLPKSQVVHQAGTYRGICCMKRLKIFLLPHSTPSRIPQHLLSRGPGRTI